MYSHMHMYEELLSLLYLRHELTSNILYFIHDSYGVNIKTYAET